MTITRTAPAAESASDVEAGPVLLLLDPSTLLIEGNVRTQASLDRDFLASVRDDGVLVPIVAVRTATGEHRVRYGQRRTLAAVETGRATVPVYVVGDEASTDAATIERISTQVAENEHRIGLSTADKTAAVEQLSLLGLSAAHISKRLKTRRGAVDHALAVAKSPLAKAATERYDFLTLDMAATVADFEADADTVKALIAAAKTSPGSFEHVAQRARDDRARAQVRADAENVLVEAGVRLVEPVTYSDRVAKKLGELVSAKDKPLTPAGHKSCPGHAAFVSFASWSDKPETVYVCTDWQTNGHRDRYKAGKVPAAQMSDAERERASQERRTVIENNKSWVSAEAVRRKWLTEFLTRKTPPKGAAVFVATELAHASHELGQALDYSGGAMLHRLFGVADRQAFAVNAENASEARAQVLTLGFILAAYEAQTNTQTWRRHDADMGRYFGFLAAHGYELSAVERLCLPPEPTAQKQRTSAATPDLAEEGVGNDDPGDRDDEDAVHADRPLTGIDSPAETAA